MGVAKEGGPLMTGCLVASVLGGVCINQAVAYFRTYGRDPWYNKVLVVLLITLICLDWAAYFKILFHLFILEPGINQLPSDPERARPIVLFCPTVATALSETFFAFRCWQLTGRNLAFGIILGVLIAIVFSLGLVTVVTAAIYTGLKDGNVLASWEKWFCAALWLAAFTDITITSFLTRALWPKRQGLSETTDSLISRVVMLSVSCAALSAVLYVADSIAMIFQIQEPHVGNVEDAFLCILPHVSTLVVLGTLNLRKTIQTPSGPTYTDPFVLNASVLNASMLADSLESGGGASFPPAKKQRGRKWSWSRRAPGSPPDVERGPPSTKGMPPEALAYALSLDRMGSASTEAAEREPRHKGSVGSLGS